MGSATYRARIVDQELVERLHRSGAVVIEGPKACGKTFTARRHAASELRVDIQPDLAALVSTAPDLALAGNTPRLLDEWQVIPALWNHVRRAVDDRQVPGQFILTGSAMPADDATRHSGAGRFSRLRMRPLSTMELGLSQATVRLQDLAAGGLQIAEPPSAITFHEILATICGGGWPGHLGASERDQRLYVREYLDEITRVDIATYETGQKPRDPQRIAAVIRSISRGLGSAIKATTIAQDVHGTHGRHGTTVSVATVATYLEAIGRVMILDEVPAWQTHLRSRASIRTNPKLYLTDPSLAVAALQANPDSLIQDLPLLGQLFENLVMRDLLVYAQHIGASVNYYRDSNGLEVDAVIDHEDGSWQAFEIKLGAESVNTAASSLKRLASTVDTTRKGPPRALSVITSNGAGYTRADGVHVIPFSLLGV